MILSDLTGRLTKPDPSLAILHLGIDFFPHNFRTVVIHVLLAAKSILARHWRQNLATNPSEVINLVNVYFFDKMYSHKAATRSFFDVRWKPWVESSF